MSAGDFGRIDSGAVGKCDQEILVAKHMLQHAGEKVGRARGTANSVRGDAGRPDKYAQSPGFFGDEGKRLNGQCFCCLA